ncbi:MAG TPA: PepSY domain-containing protein [Gemmatimonadaceae bacterium]|nr:PepSY domain-containing protein [Gemmatimonadaceae bacterium]
MAPALHAQAEKIKETKPGLLKKAKLTPDSAIAAAQAKLPKAKFDAGELEEEGGKLIYSLDFKTDGKTGIDEVNIDAMTGKLVGKINHESPADEAKEAKAEKEKAAKKAAKKP